MEKSFEREVEAESAGCGDGVCVQADKRVVGRDDSQVWRLNNWKDNGAIDWERVPLKKNKFGGNIIS